MMRMKMRNAGNGADSDAVEDRAIVIAFVREKEICFHRNGYSHYNAGVSCCGGRCGGGLSWLHHGSGCVRVYSLPACRRHPHSSQCHPVCPFPSCFCSCWRPSDRWRPSSRVKSARYPGAPRGEPHHRRTHSTPRSVPPSWEASPCVPPAAR